MGVQDDLALIAAGHAVKASGFLGAVAGDRVGLYIAVGYIPFEERDIDRLVEKSVDESGFSMARFSTEGLGAINPLLTFRCLPNMPAFHISLNFELRGPYFVTYPGPGQFYLALEQACLALESGTVDVAVVGGVAHQRNFLVHHHLQRLDPPTPIARTADAAGCVVLERESSAAARGVKLMGRLLDWEISYQINDPLREPRALTESFAGETPSADMGAASLPALLATGEGKRTVTHDLSARDGIVAQSRWELA